MTAKSSSPKSKNTKKATSTDTRAKKETIDTPKTTTEKSSEPNNTWRVGQLFWGGLFVVIGSLLLLQNLNIIETDLSALWQLWPLFIIATGLSILSTKNILWKTLLVIFVLMMLTFVTLVGLGRFNLADNHVRTDTSVVLPNQSTNTTETSLKMGAGSLTIRSAEQQEVVQANLKSSFAELVENQSQDGDTQRINLETKGSGTWWFGTQKNELDVILSKDIAQAFSLDVGASSVDADFSEIELTSLQVKTGASSVSIRLGERSDALPVVVDAGASSVKLAVPKESGVRVVVESGLSSQNLPGLSEKGDGVFETEDYDSATKKITVTIKSGLSSFELSRY